MIKLFSQRISIAWDQGGIPPYYQLLKEVINISLDKGCYWFISYQFETHQLLMPHTWLLEAYEKLKQTNEGKQYREEIFFLNYNTSTVEKRRENMDWVNAIEKAIQYIEDHLIERYNNKRCCKICSYF